MPITRIIYAAFSCVAFCVLVFVSFCSKNPLDGNLAARKGTVIIKTASLDSILAKETKAESIHHMTASITNQGAVVQSKTVNKDAGNTSAQFTFSDMEPASNLTAFVSVFDDDQNEKYRAQSSSFSITAGQVATVLLGSWSFLIDEARTEFTATPASIPADGTTHSVVKLIPCYGNGNTMGAGLTVVFNASMGTWANEVAYNSSDQSYTRSIKSSTVGTGTITASIKPGTLNANFLTKNTTINFGTVLEIEPQMVFVPAGSFQMGDNLNEGFSNERPVHTVYLDAYYIGKYEVTNAEYKKFIDDGGYTKQTYWTAGEFGSYGSQPDYWTDVTYHGGGIAGNENFPVVGVSWFEAMAYCKWLAANTGKTYRLPTEAEWEKAARGTDQRRFPWGTSIDGSHANYRNSGDPYDNGLTPVGYYDGSTHGSFATSDNASPYGAYDMAGNVWECCYDWFSSTYYAGSSTSNPLGPASGSNRVVRGGSWEDLVSYIIINISTILRSSLRSALRHGNIGPAERYGSVGFRCLRDN